MTSECVANRPPIRKPKPQGPRSGFLRLSPLSQALDLRDKAFAKLQADNLTPAEFDKLTRAWCEYNDRAREMQGYGKPKSVPARNDPGAKPRKAQVPAGPLPDKPGE